jgi:tetratricopeptide (TPR) repeat protein
LKHLDEEIKKRVKDSLNQSRKLYESHKFSEAAAALDQGMKLEAFQPVLAYNLALCYYQAGERGKALEYLGKAKAGTPDPKQKQKLSQLLTFFSTGENGSSVNDSDRDRISRVNHLADSVGLEASLGDEEGAEESFSEADDASADTSFSSAASSGAPASNAAAMQPAKQVLPKASPPASTHSSTNASHRASLCDALAELKGPLAKSPSATFNLANCAETNGRTAEVARLLEKYLEMAPNALDANDARARIADLKSLLSLPGQKGVEVRRLYASVYGSLAEREYDRALTDLTKAGDLAREFPLTKWKLGLLYEAMGDVDQARENFTHYQQLSSDQSAKDEATLHLTTLDAKRDKYDEEVDEAEDIVADLFNRSMKLTFNGSE